VNACAAWFLVLPACSLFGSRVAIECPRRVCRYGFTSTGLPVRDWIFLADHHAMWTRKWSWLCRGFAWLLCALPLPWILTSRFRRLLKFAPESPCQNCRYQPRARARVVQSTPPLQMKPQLLTRQKSRLFRCTMPTKSENLKLNNPQCFWKSRANAFAPDAVNTFAPDAVNTSSRFLTMRSGHSARAQVHS
jgi:hypothetical protein